LTEMSTRTLSRIISACALLAAFASSSATASAQSAVRGPVADGSMSGLPASPRGAYTDPPQGQTGSLSEASATLPDAPGMGIGIAGVSSSANGSPTQALGSSASARDSTAGGQAASLPEASHTEKYIEPGQAAPSLAASDKVLLGLRDAFSPFAAVGWLASAGWEQIVNGSPNYGTDRGAFGQRLGAAAIRDATEGIFSDSVMSPLLREDPRYYRLGPAHNFFIRAVYAGTRPIITRTDGGRTSPNLALLAGTLGGAALTNTYYPQLNRGATQTLETFGGSLGGSAVGDLVSEFYGDVMHLFHLGHD